MSETFASRLAMLGHSLPAPSAPAANYVSTIRAGNLLIVSGQISTTNGDVLTGTVGAGVSAEEGRLAAEYAAVGVLAQIAAATDGSLASIRRVARLGVFIASAPDFTDHSQVANGASDLFVHVLGEAGRHARASVGVASLPGGATVEVEALVELEPAA
ncbi:enamine deaminase RidA (YjgF/YER057c/UK114 family) [Sinorhizobium kostiense]|uniref:Enamine deaminase RidA (YjgF/YER057c/UK114 family) n=1 Tax=Sinorhizobium kostiense TaxID=76747 RepID=A0ABS4QVN1_9HYPH|nr:RidA family protein [Sinorhizobium kostiense]MBP2234529.1 enamine deaminase RidA (YjgF/YER057c/UK114 family) [Sinorhizobium kostiense]